MDMRVAMLGMILCLGLSSARMAQAGSAELRLQIARLQESLDAGLSRADLRVLRIEIGAEIRLQSLQGTNRLADLPTFQSRLAAVDMAWGVLATAAPCQLDKGVVRAVSECRALVAPAYQTLQLPPPELAATPNPGLLIQPMLKALQKFADATLRALL